MNDIVKPRRQLSVLSKRLFASESISPLSAQLTKGNVCRESNVPLHIPASHLNDLIANPMMSSWIASNSAEGPEREAFYQKAFQTFIDIAKERSYMLEDGSFCAPTHTMLYFTASKP